MLDIDLSWIDIIFSALSAIVRKLISKPSLLTKVTEQPLSPDLKLKSNFESKKQEQKLQVT